MDKTPEQLELSMDADKTFGPVYRKSEDGTRIARQMDVVRELMFDGKKRTVAEISKITGFPETSVSAQLRHLRKPRFGGYAVLAGRDDKKDPYHYWIDGQYFTQLPKK